MTRLKIKAGFSFFGDVPYQESGFEPIKTLGIGVRARRIAANMILY